MLKRHRFSDYHAPVAKLADAPDLGSGVFDVGVQVPSGAPNSRNPNRIFPVEDGFGFLLYLDHPNFNSKLKNTNIEIS